jgi:predicted enzyme related to lactoylglutathione lyase
MLTPINYIEFYCSDIKAIKSFYSSAFGWSFTYYGDDYAAFEDGFISGGFQEIPDAPKAGSPLVILYSDELENHIEKITQAGGTIVKELFSFPGGRRFHFADPCGNVLAVWSTLA